MTIPVIINVLNDHYELDLLLNDKLPSLLCLYYVSNSEKFYIY